MKRIKSVLKGIGWQRESENRKSKHGQSGSSQLGPKGSTKLSRKRKVSPAVSRHWGSGTDLVVDFGIQSQNPDPFSKVSPSGGSDVPDMLPAKSAGDPQYLDVGGLLSPVRSHPSTSNARLSDEDLLASLRQSPSIQTDPQIGQNFQPVHEQKRRRRRESHNLAERQRRDNVNERIRDLSSLSPCLGTSKTSKLSVLEDAVTWTRDLMWALHLKIGRESELKKHIVELGGDPIYESLTVEESSVARRLQLALEANDITCFSSGTRTLHHARRASEPLQKRSVLDVGQEDCRPQRTVRKVTSQGSIISYVASVHSLTSVTYRTPDGNLEVETHEETSNLSYVPSKDRVDKGNEDVAPTYNAHVDDKKLQYSEKYCTHCRIRPVSHWKERLFGPPDLCISCGLQQWKRDQALTSADEPLKNSKNHSSSTLLKNSQSSDDNRPLPNIHALPFISSSPPAPSSNHIVPTSPDRKLNSESRPGLDSGLGRTILAHIQ